MNADILFFSTDPFYNKMPLKWLGQKVTSKITKIKRHTRHTILFWINLFGNLNNKNLLIALWFSLMRLLNTSSRFRRSWFRGSILGFFTPCFFYVMGYGPIASTPSFRIRHLRTGNCGGLRQGCALAPTLFKIYLEEALKSCRHKCCTMGI